MLGETDFLKNIYATAEHTWALLMALFRHLPQAYDHVIEGGWNRDIFKGYELNGRTLGIIGLGRIGSKIANYGTAFGMKVIASDPNPVNLNSGTRLVSICDLLSYSDVVCLHANYLSDNSKMFNAKYFKAMKAGSVFVNTARGEMVDEEALVAALESGRIAGAAIDVLANETKGGLINNPLIGYAKKHKNLIITPHIGGATFESMEKTEIFMANKLNVLYSSKIYIIQSGLTEEDGVNPSKDDRLLL